MRLIIIPFDEKMNPIDAEVLEFASCTKEEVKGHLKSVMKGKLYQIEIYKNLNDSLFIQLDPDSKGTIIFLNYNKKEYIDELKEHGYETAITVINDYIEKNGGEIISSYILEKEEEKKRLEKEKFEKWKKTYDPKAERDKIPLKRLALVIIAAALLCCTAYLMWSGEIGFIGKRVKKTKAVVSQIKLVPVRGGYYQRVTYEFTVNNKTFKNYFTADKSTGMQYKGDSIFVKFDADNPTISKYISNNN